MDLLNWIYGSVAPKFSTGIIGWVELFLLFINLMYIGSVFGIFRFFWINCDRTGFEKVLLCPRKDENLQMIESNW